MRVKNRRDLGALLREQRLRTDMTQEEVATAAGVQRQWLIAVEAGTGNRPSTGCSSCCGPWTSSSASRPTPA